MIVNLPKLCMPKISSQAMTVVIILLIELVSLAATIIVTAESTKYTALAWLGPKLWEVFLGSNSALFLSLHIQKSNDPPPPPPPGK